MAACCTVVDIRPIERERHVGSAHSARVTMGSCVGGGRGGESLGSPKRPIRGRLLASAAATRAAARWTPRWTPSLLSRTLLRRAGSGRERHFGALPHGR